MLAVIVFALAIALVHAYVALQAPIVVEARGLFMKDWLDALHATENGLYISMGISFLISLTCALFFNRMLNDAEVLYRQTYFPALFYFYFCNLFPVQSVITPHLLASVLLLLLVYKFFSLEKGVEKATPFLDMGFFSGLAFFFTPDTLLFIPALWIALTISGYLTFRRVMFYITGFSIPIYFIGLGSFLADKWGYFVEYFIYSHFTFDLNRFNISIEQMVLIGFIILVLMVSASRVAANFNKNTIRSRRSQQGMFFFMLSGLGVTLVSEVSVYQVFTLFALPLSPFIAYYFLKNKRRWMRETVFALFFIISIIALFAYHTTG